MRAGAALNRAAAARSTGSGRHATVVGLPRLIIAATLIVLAACSPSPGEPRAGAPATHEAENRDDRGHESGDCAAIAARFRQALGEATGTCSSDSDCACYNAVIPEAGCGGITDAATAARLAGIEHDFHAASCPWPHQCGASLCQPHCTSSRCAR